MPNARGKYKPTIGLEIHAALKTRTKLFCDSLNDPDEQHPNYNVCPVCLGHPGTLPVINREAVKHVIRVGLALGGTIAPVTKFDRKNYFYPDLPKGYQISQYDQPLVSGGELEGVAITRVHLEEDAGRLVHPVTMGKVPGSVRVEKSVSLVDFNRAGVPLMELVTEPDIESADHAVRFAKELQLILRYLDTSDADMEKGQMRVEANVSVRLADTQELGTKVEVKNINSFKAVHDAIEYEVTRQIGVLRSGEKVMQETRGWDDHKNKTFSQRSKEEAHDYRYFPEPDLPPFATSMFDVEQLEAALPELPREKRERLGREYNLDRTTADFFASDPAYADFFEKAVSELRARDDEADISLLVNYLTSDLRGLLKEAGVVIGESKVSAEEFGHLVYLVDERKLTSRQAKDILKLMFETGEDPEVVIAEHGFEQVDVPTVETAVRKVIESNPKPVTEFKSGKEQALQFLIGKTMAELKGQGDPKTIRAILERELR